MNRDQAVNFLAGGLIGETLHADAIHTDDKVYKLQVCQMPDYNGGTMLTVLGFAYGTACPISQLPLTGWVE